MQWTVWECLGEWWISMDFYGFLWIFHSLSLFWAYFNGWGEVWTSEISEAPRLPGSQLGSWEAIGPFLRFEGLLPNMPPARHKTSDGLGWVKSYTTRTTYLIVPKLGTILTYTGAAGFWPTLIPWYLDTLIPWYLDTLIPWYLDTLISLSLSLSLPPSLSLSLYHYPTISPWDPYDIPINHHCNQMRHSFPLATKALCLWRAQPGVRATWQRGGLRFTEHPGSPSIKIMVENHGFLWTKSLNAVGYADENQAGYPEYPAYPEIPGLNMIFTCISMHICLPARQVWNASRWRCSTPITGSGLQPQPPGDPTGDFLAHISTMGGYPYSCGCESACFLVKTCKNYMPLRFLLIYVDLCWFNNFIYFCTVDPYLLLANSPWSGERMLIRCFTFQLSALWSPYFPAFLLLNFPFLLPIYLYRLIFFLAKTA